MTEDCNCRLNFNWWPGVTKLLKLHIYALCLKSRENCRAFFISFSGLPHCAIDWLTQLFWPQASGIFMLLEHILYCLFQPVTWQLWFSETLESTWMNGCQWQCDILYSYKCCEWNLISVYIKLTWPNSCLCVCLNPLHLCFNCTPSCDLWQWTTTGARQAHGIYLLAWQFQRALRGGLITVSACGLTLLPLQRCFVWAENKMKPPISSTENPRPLNPSKLHQSMLV